MSVVTVTVQLDWKPNAQFAGLLLAQHLGWFAEADLDVRIRPWTPGTDPLERVPHDVGTIAVSEDNLAIRAAATGHPIRLVGAMLQRSPLAWMVLEDSPIQQFPELAGATIGVHGDGITALQYALGTAGLDLSSVDLVDVPYDKADRLRDGTIDACQCNGLVEPVELRHAGVPVRVMWATDVGYSVYSQVLSTSNETVRTQGDEVSAFTDIMWNGWRQAYVHPTTTATLVIEHFLHESSVEVQREILGGMEAFVFGDAATTAEAGSAMAPVGAIEVDRLDASIDLLVATRVIRPGLSASHLLGH